ncbi:MAG: helix-turn-helix transcriptional regulator [Butyricicoccus porcorum]|nr:helix-turn-helix transcriptional regulator [Butyricicoccus porcorum]
MRRAHAEETGVNVVLKTLQILKQVAASLAQQFGPNCEIVIHDLRSKDLNQSIVHIENGHVSNRKVGDGPSEVVLKAMKTDGEVPEDRSGYLTTTTDGKVLKSSTIYIKDEEGRPEYIFAINFDISTLLAAQNALENLTSAPKTERPPEISHNVSELLDQLLEQSVALVGKPVALMNKDDKVAAIKFLNDAGAFLITHSGDRVANYFGISKFTLYSYIGSSK